MNEPLLIVEGLRVTYGGIQAVRGITFHINPGEMVALIGANGAGKTSTLRALSRMLDAAGGSIRYQGKEINKLPPYHLVREGIALVPEGRGVFPRLTITENLSMGAFTRNDKVVIESDLEHVFGLFPRLKEREKQLAGTLSGGEQQMLAIGRALMSRPKLLLLDEPSMGLAPIMVQKIFEVIRTVASEGMTILLIEQNAKLALETSQRGYVMESGEITLTDDAAALLHNPKVREAYLGE
ncbi:MAG: branched-chain amino acid transport system ATP-binding protein [Pseudomonadota bacterium]|nr:branched-chain amino acid transport system ATP-binding protein [Pseudomonadota bacterium]